MKVRRAKKKDQLYDLELWERQEGKTRRVSTILRGKSFTLCQHQSLVLGRTKGQFYKIPEHPKNMSQVRQDLLEVMSQFLQEEAILIKDEPIDQDKPLGQYNMNPEQELKFLIAVEKAYNLRFNSQQVEVFAKNIEIGTASDLVSIIIKILNRDE